MVVKIFKILLWTALCLSSLAFANFPSLPPPALVIPSTPELAAKAFILLDFFSDFVISEQEANARVEPASLTKMMTVYVVDQAIKAKKISLTDKVRISEKAWRSTGSRMFLDLNSEVPVDQILNGIIIQSGNDASIAIAEHIAGTESTFAELMNYYAQQLGMTNTHFVNATGLPENDHYTTARDMAILAKALIRDFPETYKTYSQKEFTYKNIKQINRNRLLWRNEWVDGIKTGHTDNAGFCLVASGQKEGMRLIAVVMGAKNDAVRTDEANKLLGYGFNFYETRKLYTKGLPVKQARIWMGVEKNINLGLAEDLYVTIGKGQYEKLKANITVDKVVKAPMKMGTNLGKLSVMMDDKVLSERAIIALNDIQPAGLVGRIYDSFALTLQSLWEKVSSL